MSKPTKPPLLAADPRARTGMVLVIAILAVLLMTAILASVFFATIEHTRAGLASARREAAIGDAEGALAASVDRLALPTFDAPTVGGTMSASDASGGRTVVYITRLDSVLYSVVADVTPTSSDADAAIRTGVVVARSVDAQHVIHVTRVPGHAWSQLF